MTTCDLYAEAYNGERSPVLGETRVVIQGPGRGKCTLNVLVSEHSTLACLLGLDAICKLGIDISGSKKELRHGDWLVPLPGYEEERTIMAAHMRAGKKLQDEAHWRVCNDVTLPPGHRCTVLVQAPTRLAVGEQVELMLDPRRRNGRPKPLQAGIRFKEGLFERKFRGTREVPAALGARCEVVATLVQPKEGKEPMAVALAEVVNVAPFAVTLRVGQVAFHSVGSARRLQGGRCPSTTSQWATKTWMTRRVESGVQRTDAPVPRQVTCRSSPVRRRGSQRL